MDRKSFVQKYRDNKWFHLLDNEDISEWVFSYTNEGTQTYSNLFALKKNNPFASLLFSEGYTEKEAREYATNHKGQFLGVETVSFYKV